MKEKFRNINIPLTICIFSVILLSLYTSIGLYNKNKTNKNYFRLHVVANSNSIDDQIVKLKIADKVEGYINTILNNDDITKQETYNIIHNNIDQILLISNNELKENNMDYISEAKLGKINYEKKENIYTTMEKGSYDSVQILLGDAKGENYWNLVFPNKENIKNLEGLENVLPGVSKIYNDENEVLEEKSYSFKFIEVLENIF